MGSSISDKVYKKIRNKSCVKKTGQCVNIYTNHYVKIYTYKDESELVIGQVDTFYVASSSKNGFKHKRLGDNNNEKI